MKIDPALWFGSACSGKRHRPTSHKLFDRFKVNQNRPDEGSACRWRWSGNGRPLRASTHTVLEPAPARPPRWRCRLAFWSALDARARVTNPTAGVWADEQLTVRVGSCSAPGTLPLRHLLCVRFCRPRASFVLNDASNLGSYSPQKSGRFQACFNAPTRYRQAQASRRAPADPGRGIPAPGAVYGEMLPAVQPSKLGGFESRVARPSRSSGSLVASMRPGQSSPRLSRRHCFPDLGGLELWRRAWERCEGRPAQHGARAVRQQPRIPDRQCIFSDTAGGERRRLILVIVPQHRGGV